MSCAGIHHVTLIVDDRDKAAWFYGEVLELEQKGRPSFSFPGLFYHCGSQEIHLIVAAKPLTRDPLLIRVGESDVTKRHIHRHAALLVPDLDRLKSRLEGNGIPLLFTEERADFDDPLTRNMVDAWQQMYGAAPIFFHDPFENLLEGIPNAQA